MQLTTETTIHTFVECIKVQKRKRHKSAYLVRDELNFGKP